jgi:hypothetical protein
MAKKCAVCALIRLLPGFFGFGGFFFHQLFVTVIGGGPEDGAATEAGPPRAAFQKNIRQREINAITSAAVCGFPLKPKTRLESTTQRFPLPTPLLSLLVLCDDRREGRGASCRRLGEDGLPLNCQRSTYLSGFATTVVR